MEPVDVLLDTDRIQNHALINVRRQRQLDEDPMHIGIRVVVGDHLEHLVLRGRVGQILPERNERASE